jgi:hypothetical protein
VDERIEAARPSPSPSASPAYAGASASLHRHFPQTRAHGIFAGVVLHLIIGQLSKLTGIAVPLTGFQRPV